MALGVSVGAYVGVKEGIDVGFVDGWDEGKRDMLGVLDGTNVGTYVGILEGILLGNIVGLNVVGCIVGKDDCSYDGCNDGLLSIWKCSWYVWFWFVTSYIVLLSSADGLFVVWNIS